MNMEDDEKRHVFGLPELAIAVTGEDEAFNDSWYNENWANLSAEMRTD